MDKARREIPGGAFVLIVMLSVVAAVVYGVLHDQVTARVCIEYFTITHPHLVDSESPTVVGLAWGVVATWWMGLFLGVPLALSARLGSAPKRSPRRMIKAIAILLVVMGVSALASGIAGYWLSASGRVPIFQDLGEILPDDRHDRWMADWWAHNASYLVGFFGGITLTALTIVGRWRDRRTGSVSPKPQNPRETPQE